MKLERRVAEERTHGDTQNVRFSGRDDGHGAPKRAVDSEQPAPIVALQRALGNRAIQQAVRSDPTSGVSNPSDPVEREADRMAAAVLDEGGDRPRLGDDRGPSSDGGDGRPSSPPIPSRGGRGRPLPTPVRSFFEPRFGRDFGDVRLHTDSDADRAARSIDARAFTAGRNVVLRSDAYQPGTERGWHLLAHELSHVVQQHDGRRPGMDLTVWRQPDADAKIKSGPGTKTGPVSGRGGLIHDASRERLSVIVGPGDTLRSIATKLLPYWNEAEPFTPPGAAASAPKTTLTAEELAKGLLVYNRYYLAVPDMTRWRVGLRFPLPIEMGPGDERTVNATLVKRWAERFEPEWESLLDQQPGALEEPSAEELGDSVQRFLEETPTTLARGIHLGARAMRNAEAAAPFVVAAFQRLGADAFETALAFMDNLVNHQIEVLAGQRAGQEILDAVRTALARAPSELSGDQQRSLTRANRMLSGLGAFETETAETFEEIYVTDVPGSHCMTAVYKGLEGLYGEAVSASVESEVRREAREARRRTSKDTNNMDRIMRTVRDRGKAGREVILRYDRDTDTWNPLPEPTLLGMTDDIAGWYFFGFSIHGAYHSVILAVDKSDPDDPKIYWMDQFSKGFENEVTGSLVAEMKQGWLRPSYGYAPTRLWQLLPPSDTLIELR